MPKVTTVNYYSEAISLGAELFVDASGTFYIKFPPEIRAVLGFEKVEAKTKDEVTKKWKECIQKFCEATRSERKVIFFKPEITATIYDAQDERGSAYHHKAIHRCDFPFERSGIVMKIEAGVFIEKKTAFDGTERYEYAPCTETMIPESTWFSGNLMTMRSGAHKSGVFVLDWTEERERTIAKFCLSLETLIMNILTFTESQEVFQKVLDSGSGLLLPTPAEELSEE